MQVRRDAPNGLPRLITGATGVRSGSPVDVEHAKADAGDTPRASVVGSVGGRVVRRADVELWTLPGRDAVVMLPKGTTWSAYVAALEKSGAFADQAEQLEALSKLTAKKAAPDARPAVGVILSEARMLVRDFHENTENVIRLVEEMGCRPVIVPPCADICVAGGADARARAVASMASTLDGLVGPGGADVNPAVYGEQNTGSLQTNPFRDAFETAFVKVALDCDLFAFGICRSHQLWNAAAGGKLVQDIQDEGLTSVSHRDGHHPMMVKRGSMIFEATRQQALRVNSLHHQAVDFAGWGFRVVAKVKDEGTGKDMIEATERWNGITTQWHPELMQDDPAMRALFSTLGRRAHAFALMKEMGRPSAAALLERMRSDPRFDATDVAWVKRELSRRL